MSHANLNRRSRGDEAVRSSRPTLLTRAAFSTSLRHQVATSLSPRMLTFLSQVPDLTFLTLRFQPRPRHPRHPRLTSGGMVFPKSTSVYIKTHSPRAHIGLRQSSRASWPSWSHRHARTDNCRLFFCKSLQSSFFLSHHGSRPLFAQRTSLAGQRTRGGVGNATERLLRGNRLVPGLTAKRFVITVVQTLGSPCNGQLRPPYDCLFPFVFIRPVSRDSWFPSIWSPPRPSISDCSNRT